ncbi:hypothetical protein ASL20_30185 [Cupriavidus necator]|uniref:Crp/Fnr family transcriptional regulator n=1 Tax=Cupriavidus necator TaxID=106590 RepID=UPI000735CA39|nr:Crp/Fnr family transcriptional regulator [Cupriavidus necator]KUE85101.1 hypothetical protein ASL20_30185 [Cupriavidus necator]
MTDSTQPASGRAIASVLQHAAWFDGCGADALQAILDQATVKALKRGEMLVHRGEPICQLSVVLAGTLEVSTTSPAGKRHVVSYLEPGQLMNLIPFVDEGGAIHDFSAHEDALVLQIGKPLFDRLIATEPVLTHRLMRTLCLRARLTYTRLTDSLLLSLRQRCAQTLLHLVSPYGTAAAQGVAISLKLSQEELADMVGCSRPMVNRELKHLEMEGVIKMTYSHYVITDVSRLRSIVDGA